VKRVFVLALMFPVMAVLAPAAPVEAVSVRATVMSAGCTADGANGDAVAGPDGRIRGVVGFDGPDCSDLLRYFEGSGGAWRVAATPYRGRLLAVTDDRTALGAPPALFVLFANFDGIFVGSRTPSGVFQPATRVSPSGEGGGLLPQGDIVAFTGQYWAVWQEAVGPGGEFAQTDLFQAKTIGAGDCIDPIRRQRVTFTNRRTDVFPTLALVPRSAGRSGAVLAWASNDGALGEFSVIMFARADCTARWEFRQLTGPDHLSGSPDLQRRRGVDVLAWVRDGRVVVADDATGSFSNRHMFDGPGVAPRVALGKTRAFVAWTRPGTAAHVLLATRDVEGRWTVRDKTARATTDRRLIQVVARADVPTVFLFDVNRARVVAVTG